MKLILLALAYLTLYSCSAAAAEIDGTWKATFTCPIGQQPKTVSEMLFDLHVNGNKITGTAHIGSWPGDAEISDGSLDGEYITFTVIGHKPWTRGWNGVLTSGYPKMIFTGTVSADQITITLNWDSILTTGGEEKGHVYPMKAMKVSESH